MHILVDRDNLSTVYHVELHVDFPSKNFSLGLKLSPPSCEVNLNGLRLCDQ